MYHGRGMQSNKSTAYWQSPVYLQQLLWFRSCEFRVTVCCWGKSRQDVKQELEAGINVRRLLADSFTALPSFLMLTRSTCLGLYCPQKAGSSYIKTILYRHAHRLIWSGQFLSQVSRLCQTDKTNNTETKFCLLNFLWWLEWMPQAAIWMHSQG